MYSKQKGFTLIELVMVIVILGILSVIALPKFVNLKGDAEQAATDGVAGALASSSAINFASRSLSTANGVAVSDCTNVTNAMEGGVPTDYSIQPGAISSGSSATCTVVYKPGGTTSASANFVGHGVN